MTLTWEHYIDKKCREVEHRLKIKPFTNKTLLIKALTRRALLNEEIEFKEKFEENGHQKGRDTLGDAVINLIVTKEAYSRNIFTRKDLTDFWKKYGNNITLHRFSNKCLKLEDFIIRDLMKNPNFEERNSNLIVNFLLPF
jgi:hypothetical protein